jgi:hypothetical protein
VQQQQQHPIFAKTNENTRARLSEKEMSQYGDVCGYVIPTMMMMMKK